MLPLRVDLVLPRPPPRARAGTPSAAAAPSARAADIGAADALVAGLELRCAELHEGAVGGALGDPRHFDSGSVVTIDVMLARPGVDFEGGHFETLEPDGTMRRHVFERGDALVFPSYK